MLQGLALAAIFVASVLALWVAVKCKRDHPEGF